MPLTVGTTAYKSAVEFLETLPRQMEGLTSEQQRKIQQLCKNILGPDPLTAAEESTTDPMDKSIPRSSSHEDLSRTEFTRGGFRTTVEVALLETADKQEARQVLKELAAKLKENQQKPFFERLVNEKDFQDLNATERAIPAELETLKKGIVTLTALIASLTVEARNDSKHAEGKAALEASFQEQYERASLFLQNLNAFQSQLRAASDKGIVQVDEALSLIGTKVEQICKISKAAAIEKANLMAQISIGPRELSMKEKYQLFGSINPQFLPTTEATGKGIALPDRLDEGSLTLFFDNVERVLSSADYLISHDMRKAFSALLGDRHSISVNLGDVRGLEEKMAKTPEAYAASRKLEQLILNDLKHLTTPLTQFKKNLADDVIARKAQVERQKQELTKAFAELQLKSQELKKALPDCQVELKTL